MDAFACFKLPLSFNRLCEVTAKAILINEIFRNFQKLNTLFQNSSHQNYKTHQHLFFGSHPT